MLLRAISSIGIVLLLIACRRVDDVKTGERPARYEIGHAPTPAEIAAIDIDANASGVGLPAGQGTAAEGAQIFAQKCASCHGAKGEGIDKVPRLIGREPAPGFVFALDAKAPKTIGNYWPYATTLYDYLHRTMPLSAPGSLTPSETYGLVAFLLSENGVVPATTVIDAKSLTAIKMP
ncbi:MAG: c-type cytochrome, partial [bacterium]